eukprot:Hpha_TRINITY_DN15802_c0_g6::TRINITY_DN15802_c0_g6_i1::g.188924::m.188924
MRVDASFLVAFLGAAGMVVAPASAGENSALQSLYNGAQAPQCGTPGNNGFCWARRNNWGTGDACTWQGVTCTGNSVTALDLNNNNLRGVINNNVLNSLPDLERLDLRDNGRLTGTFPQQLAQMPKLSEIRLGTGLTGAFPAWDANHPETFEHIYIDSPMDDPLPDLKDLTNIKIFDIRRTRITTQIPPFDAFTVNDVLRFWNNDILTGTIPDLTSLTVNRVFEFWGNDRLSGTVPLLSPLTQTTDFTIGYNDVSGTVPKTLGNMTSLVKFNMEHNCGSNGDCNNCDLSGTLPPLAPENQNTLEEFRINHNSIEAMPYLFAAAGSSPTNEAPPYNNLRIFHYHQNLIHGTLPCHQSAYPNLEEIRGYENRQRGVLPCLDDMRKVRYWDLSDNDFLGVIPNVWAAGGDARALEHFDIDNNRLTGTIPQVWVDKLTAIQFLGLGANQFTGTIPDLRTKPELTQVHFHRNYAWNRLQPAAYTTSGNTPPDLSAMFDNDPNTVYTCDPDCVFEFDFGAEVCVETFEFTDGPDLRPTWKPLPPDAPTNAAHTRPSKGCVQSIRTWQSSMSIAAGDIDDEMLDRWYCNHGWNWGTCFPGTQKVFGRERRTNNPWGNWDPWCRVRTRFYKLQIRDCEDPPCRIAELKFYGGDKRSTAGDGITDRMSGTLPDLAQAPNLDTLWAYGNDLTGTLPLVQAQNRWRGGEFFVDDNRLEGPLPDWCPSVFQDQSHVFLDYNWFTGTIPDMFCIDDMQRLRMGDNMLSGTIPNCTCTRMYEWLADNNACCKLFREEGLRTRNDINQGYSCPRCDCAVPGQVPCIWPGDCEEDHTTYAQCPTGGPNWQYPVPGQHRPEGCLWEYPGGGLEGRLPDYITYPELQRYGVDNNKLRGPMGDRNVSTLTRLEWYRARNNIFAGTLPWDQMDQAADDHRECWGVRWYLGNNTMWGTVPTIELSLSRGNNSRCGINLNNRPGGWCPNDGRRYCDIDIQRNFFWGPLPGGLERIQDDIWTRHNCWDCPSTPQGTYPGAFAPEPWLNATWEVPTWANCYQEQRDVCTNNGNGGASWWGPDCATPETYTYDGPTCPAEPPGSQYEQVEQCRPNLYLNRTLTEDDIRRGAFMQVSFEKPEVGSKKAAWALRFFTPNLFHAPCPAIGPADPWGPNGFQNVKLTAVQQVAMRAGMISRTNQADGWNRYTPVTPGNIQVGEAPGNDQWVPLPTELDIRTDAAPTYDIAVAETIDIEVPDDILLSPFTAEPQGQAVEFTVVPSPGTVNPFTIAPSLDMTELDVRDGTLRGEARQVNLTAGLDIGETFVNGSCWNCLNWTTSGTSLTAPRTCDFTCAVGRQPLISLVTCSQRLLDINFRLPAYDIADGAEEIVTVCVTGSCVASGLEPCSNCIMFRIVAVTEPPPTMTPSIYKTPTATRTTTLRPFCHFFAQFDSADLTTFCMEDDEFVWWPWLLALSVLFLPFLCIKCRPPTVPPLADLVDLPAIADPEDLMIGVSKAPPEQPVPVTRPPAREVVTLRTRLPPPPPPPEPLQVTARVVPEPPGIEVTARPVTDPVTVTARPAEPTSANVAPSEPPPVLVRATATGTGGSLRRHSAPAVSPPHRRNGSGADPVALCYEQRPRIIKDFHSS